MDSLGGLRGSILVFVGKGLRFSLLQQPGPKKCILLRIDLIYRAIKFTVLPLGYGRGTLNPKP